MYSWLRGETDVDVAVLEIKRPSFDVIISPSSTMSEEIEILLAAKSFHETLEHLLEALDEEWISQSQGSMYPGGKLDLASLSQSVFFEQFRCALCPM